MTVASLMDQYNPLLSSDTMNRQFFEVRCRQYHIHLATLRGAHDLDAEPGRQARRVLNRLIEIHHEVDIAAPEVSSRREPKSRTTALSPQFSATTALIALMSDWDRRIFPHSRMPFSRAMSWIGKRFNPGASSRTSIFCSPSFMMIAPSRRAQSQAGFSTGWVTVTIKSMSPPLAASSTRDPKRRTSASLLKISAVAALMTLISC